MQNHFIALLTYSNTCIVPDFFKLKSKDFYEITRRTLLATNKYNNRKVVSILEGGYDLNALAESADEHVKALQQNK